MLAPAEADGRLKPGGTVVEYTGGSTGTSLAFVCAPQRLRDPHRHLRRVQPGEARPQIPRPLGRNGEPRKIEGVGIGYTPPLWDASLVDEVVPVRTDDAKAMARRLAREDAMFAGTSSGVNVLAALEVAERLGPGATEFTLMAPGPEIPEHRRVPKPLRRRGILTVPGGIQPRGIAPHPLPTWLSLNPKSGCAAP